jgi:N-acetylneuraminate synthase
MRDDKNVLFPHELGVDHATISIGGRLVGRSHKPFIIAEVAQAHDGSLGLAHSFVDAAARHGADGVKFQTHIAELESTPGEAFRVKFSYEDATRFDYWKRMEFTPEQWAGLADHCRQKNIVFLSSPFSPEAIQLLDRLDMPAIKFGSGEIHNKPMLNVALETGKPLLLSSGMSSLEEMDETTGHIRARGGSFAVFQATSKYPTPLTEVGLNVMDTLRERYGVPVGLSDHSASIWPAVTAMARGASLIEVHVTFDRMMFGPDTPASLTFAELAQVTSARDAISVLDANPVDKAGMAAELTQMRLLFRKSLALKTPQKAGIRLESGMFMGKKPGTGIPYEEMERVTGRILRRDVGTDRVLSWEDIE